jgi:hypothetical protein
VSSYCARVPFFPLALLIDRLVPCSHDVQLAAVSALYNSLEFVRENFEREVRYLESFYSSCSSPAEVCAIRASGTTLCKSYARLRSPRLSVFRWPPLSAWSASCTCITPR